MLCLHPRELKDSPTVRLGQRVTIQGTLCRPPPASTSSGRRGRTGKGGVQCGCGRRPERRHHHAVKTPVVPSPPAQSHTRPADRPSTVPCIYCTVQARRRHPLLGALPHVPHFSPPVAERMAAAAVTVAAVTASSAAGGWLWAGCWGPGRRCRVAAARHKAARADMSAH